MPSAQSRFSLCSDVALYPNRSTLRVKQVWHPPLPSWDFIFALPGYTRCSCSRFHRSAPTHTSSSTNVDTRTLTGSRRLGGSLPCCLAACIQVTSEDIELRPCFSLHRDQAGSHARRSLAYRDLDSHGQTFLKGRQR